MATAPSRNTNENSQGHSSDHEYGLASIQAETSDPLSVLAMAGQVVGNSGPQSEETLSDPLVTGRRGDLLSDRPIRASRGHRDGHSRP